MRKKRKLFVSFLYYFLKISTIFMIPNTDTPIPTPIRITAVTIILLSSIIRCVLSASVDEI